MAVVFEINFKRPGTLPVKQYSRSDGLFLEGSNGCTVILVHGLTGTPCEMRFLAYSLHNRGYSIACPRLANHGEPLETLKYTQWQDFYQTVRQAFLEARGKSQMIFAAGLSMGALLSLLLAEEFPDEIKGVSCLSPTLFYDGWNMPRVKCLLPLAYRTFLRNFFYFKEDPPYGIKNEALRNRVHKYYSQSRLRDTAHIAEYGYPYFPVTLLHQLNLLVKYVDTKFKAIRVPVQLIQAKDDDMTSVKNSQYIYDRIASGDKEIVLLYNSYHMITADQERDKVARELARFFDAVGNGTHVSQEASKEVLKDA